MLLLRYIIWMKGRVVTKEGKRNPADLFFLMLTAIASCSILFLTAGILIVLVKSSSLAINTFGFFHFIVSQEWNPVAEVFGAASTLYGTLVTTTLSLFFAIPIAIGIAIFVTEVAPASVKTPISMAIELLAAIPSIIYGMWGLFTLAPLMSNHIEPFLQSTLGTLPFFSVLMEGTPMGIDLLTASVILSIMIIPFTASIARDSFELTPSFVKESAYGLGATKWDVIKNVVMPYSKLGIFGGIVLSMGRALGETMAVAFVLGNKHEITSSLLDAAATITVSLANEFAEADSDLYLSSLFYLALVLFLMSFVTLAIAKLLLLRAERRYSR